MSSIIKNHLAEYGFEIIALPKADFAPLQLLTKQGKALSRYGTSLLDLFEPDEAGVPTRQTTTANITGGQLLSTNASAGVNLLSGLFSALKLNDSKLKASLGRIRGLGLSFTYQDIEEEYVDLMALDNFIVGAIPKKEGFQGATERLQNSELYVIQSLLRSSQIDISLNSVKSDEVNVEEAVQGIAEANASINRSGSHGFSLSIPDAQSMAFAFKAVRILYDDKRWFQFWNHKEAGFRIKDQKGMVLKGPEDFPVSPLRTDEGISEF